MSPYFFDIDQYFWNFFSQFIQRNLNYNITIDIL